MPKPFAIHPGEILLEEFRGKRSITADTALRLGAYFHLPAQFWMNLQTCYDLRLAAANQDLKKIKPRRAA
jgi:plasmid maintenance system antidote protein VapI